jgi:hypothetical protein
MVFYLILFSLHRAPDLAKRASTALTDPGALLLNCERLPRAV